MGEPAGGGLNRRVCQLVDWMLWKPRRQPGSSVPQKSSITNLEVIGRSSIILINSIREDNQGVADIKVCKVFCQWVIKAWRNAGKRGDDGIDSSGDGRTMISKSLINLLVV